MFGQLSEAITCANNEVEKIENGYVEKRQSTAVKIQKEMEAELERMKTQVALKDYSPIEHHNKIATFNSEYQTMSVAEKNECEAVKNKLYDQLMSLMQKKACPVSEMYKIISSSGNDKGNYVCRVWFTLVPIKEWNCIAGDPIRVEWKLNHGYMRENDNMIDPNYDVVSHRTGEGINGLKFPEMINNGQVCSPLKFFGVDELGREDIRVKRWEQWLQTNRPC